MSKKRAKRLIISAERQFELDKPRYNPFQTGHGVHVSGKCYNRKRKHRNREDW